MKREYTDEEMIAYNRIVAAICNNIRVENYRMGDKIILWDFQQDQEMDRLYYNVAILMSDVLGVDVYLEMPLMDYLIFKWKRRKRKNIKRVNNKIRDKIEINKRTSIYEIMTFVQREFDLSDETFEDINDCFYGEWVE